jgi:hypothetical protein
MQHANYHERIGTRHIVDRVSTVECHAQAGRQLLARRAGQGEVPQRFEGGFQRRDKACGCLLGYFFGDIGPDPGEVGFGCLGYFER